MEVIKQISTKSNNARRIVTLIRDEGNYFFILQGKRLVDRKERLIANQQAIFTVETFYNILHLMNLFTDNDIRKLFSEPIIKDVISVYKNKDVYGSII